MCGNDRRTTARRRRNEKKLKRVARAQGEISSTRRPSRRHPRAPLPVYRAVRPPPPSRNWIRRAQTFARETCTRFTGSPVLGRRPDPPTVKYARACVHVADGMRAYYLSARHWRERRIDNKRLSRFIGEWRVGTCLSDACTIYAFVLFMRRLTTITRPRKCINDFVVVHKRCSRSSRKRIKSVISKIFFSWLSFWIFPFFFFTRVFFQFPFHNTADGRNGCSCRRLDPGLVSFTAHLDRRRLFWFEKILVRKLDFI